MLKSLVRKALFAAAVVVGKRLLSRALRGSSRRAGG